MRRERCASKAAEQILRLRLGMTLRKMEATWLCAITENIPTITGSGTRSCDSWNVFSDGTQPRRFHLSKCHPEPKAKDLLRCFRGAPFSPHDPRSRFLAPLGMTLLFGMTDVAMN